MKKRKTVDQLVDCEYRKWLDQGCKGAGWLSIPTKLLKAERARVRRMVNRNKQTAKCRPMGFERTDGYLMACDDILAKLREGR